MPSWALVAINASRRDKASGTFRFDQQPASVEAWIERRAVKMLNDRWQG
jgi:hypothetical protein